MHKKEFIRNVGIIAHIDHGKTTLSDSLLIDAGLLATQVAGSARVLDYLEEEQRRGITIKTANISFLHRMGKDTYLVNLVDTPGHVDFVDRVSRALRAVDSVIVVVDAVEEIMAQTETVMRLALEERVRPLLFINKVDRLVRELRLSSNEIYEKFIRIINDFNDMIEIYCEPDFRKKWKVDAAKESVIFGSALYKWGFTLKTAEKKGIRFNGPDTIETYRKGHFERLSENVPLHTAILDMVVKHAPNPAESQKYRVPKIWKGNLLSEIGRAMLNCDENGPMVMCVTQVKLVPDEGLVVVGRVFSGTLREGELVYLLNARQRVQVKKVQIYMSSFREPVGKIPAGNIAALTGHARAVRIGETIADDRYLGLDGSFESLGRVSEPVMSVAVEPKNPKDLGRLVEGLNKLTTEDPDLEAYADKETGQYLLNGLGELHLEVASNLLKQVGGGLELKVSDPIASYRETILKKGALTIASGWNGPKVSIRVEPLDIETIEILGKSSSLVNHGMSGQFSGFARENILAVEEHANILVDFSGIGKRTDTVSEALVSGFKWACRNGPLCEQPLRGTTVNLIDANVNAHVDDIGNAQISRVMSRSILGSFLTASPVLLEPIFRIEVSVSLQWLGACINVMTHRHGKIESTEQKGATAIIVGYIPVAQTFGLSKDLRSATSGHAFWQLGFHHWERVPERRSVATVQQLREKKGLSSEVPKPETFVDEVLY
jgi:elongation factor 2